MRKMLQFRRLAVLAALLSVTPSTAAVLKTITVDGQMSDWAEVLADSYQTSYDGPAGGLPDADAPVPSTGRDLTTFAWTYDTNYFYFYVARVQSASNRQLFWLYLDTDEDGLMESGEPVVNVIWWGNTGVTEVHLYTYVAASPGGDPLGDASGQADGWTMPGTVQYLSFQEALFGGAANGVEMESRVSWSALGVASGTPMRFHVSSSNSPNIPQQIDDNMGVRAASLARPVSPV